MNRELNVVVMPGGSLQLEWTDTEETINKSAGLLQDEIHNRFVFEPASWLLFLGFCDKKFSRIHRPLYKKTETDPGSGDSSPQSGYRDYRR